MPIEKIYRLFQLSDQKISTDTRECCNDTLFFALKGDNFDGNNYALQALDKGAKKAIVSDEKLKNNPNCILVDDTLETLHRLANCHRKKIGIKILAITGSNGKTTTKELTKLVLSQKYTVRATQGNYNNQIGVPLTILSFREDTDFGIVEMGTNYPGEIEILTQIAEPDYGIITNIGKAHLEGFGSVENIAREKTALYHWLMENNKVLFVNKNNVFLNKYSGVAYYTSPLPYSVLDSYAEIKSKFPLKILFDKYYVRKFPYLFGSYNVQNLLAAYTIGKYFKIDKSKIVDILSNYQPTNNRSQIIQTKRNNTVIIDCYNANPTSMQKSIESFLSTFKKKKKCLILGEMKELGKTSTIEHNKLIENRFIQNDTDIFLVGAEFNKINHKYKNINNISHLYSYLKENSIKNTHILLKGSRSNQLEKVLPLL